MIGWKGLRAGVAFVMGVLFFGIFLTGFNAYLLADIQLVPALVRVGTLSLVALAAVTMIFLLTILLGRVYCSVVCPLGILQDVMGRISIWANRKKRYRPQRRWSFLHYGAGLVLLLSLLSGSAAILGFLDPYSMFGRLATHLGQPVVITLNNFGAWAGRHAGWYVFAAEEWSFPPLWSYGWSLLLFTILLLLVFWNGRVFCNTLCPAGAVLRLLSRYSWLQIGIDSQSCNRCGACQSVCKAGCIDRKARRIDFERCVSCHNCTSACHRGSIGYRLNPFWQKLFSKGKAEQSAMALGSNQETVASFGNATDKSRRSFIVSGAISLSAVATTGSTRRRHRGGRGNGGQNGRYYEEMAPAIPPGAGRLERFQSLCTGCQLCVSRCPTHTLKPGFLELGWKGMEQPIFDFSRGYCDFECRLCTEVCPTGALDLVSLADKKRIRIGMARFFSPHCVVRTEGNECGACVEHCPTMAVIGVPYHTHGKTIPIPEVKNELCVGCGICEHVCPVKPAAIRVEGLAVHETAEVMENAPLQDTPDLTEDFPF